ncbi:ABC transporter substrate-binding protein [Arthrobacter ginkgonis]|uniref:ABC transporter substrate-binding protein n=1 Tax=Arthrobacter ginkgonis TaxID=1630594 RepID=UPI0031E8BAC7
MSQSIDVGTVLGGRYKVTALVLTSADGDLVLDGSDQVLNRPVSILVASASNASQVATSAREIATGERYGAMQVLDLGISEGNTYLITNTANPADLLDLVILTDGPYVEPFYTDTLGSEIFGVSRSSEPQVYEDDDEYYEELLAQEENRPGVMDRLPEINLSDKLSGLKSRFGRGRDAGLPEFPVAGAAAAASAPSAPAARPAPPAPSAQPVSSAQPASSVPPAPAAPPTAAVRSAEADSTGELEEVAPPAAPATSPKVSLWTEEEERPSDAEAPVRPAAPAARPGSDPFAGEAMKPIRSGASSRNAATFPAAARGYVEEPSAEPDYDGYEDEEPEEGRKKITRLIVGGVLGVVLIVAVVFAFNALSPKDAAPVAGNGAATSESGSAPASPTAEAPAGTGVSPEIAALTRVVPGNQQLNAETDGTLAKAIDGNSASYYATYSYTQPQFGGFAANMVLVVKLEELSDVSSVELSGLNGTGGAFEIRVGETDDLGASREVSSGSFTGPAVTVPVSGEDGGAAQAQYVFINVTELPKLAAGVNSSRPYGLQVAEIKVS